LAGAQLPKTGIGVVVQLPGAFADFLQGVEVLDARRAKEPPVEEGLGAGQHDLAIGIVLDLLVGLIAHPDRAHAAIARQQRRGALLQAGFAQHPVKGLDVAPLGAVDDVAQVDQVVFQDVERAQPVESLHRVVGVPDPAIAVVPVTLRSGVLRDRGGQRGDDRAGLLVLAKLEGNGRADHRVLPVERNGQAAHPMPPLAAGADQHVVDRARKIAREAFVGPEKEVQRPLKAERQLLVDHADRRRGREPHRHGPGLVANVVGAADRGARPLTPVAGGAQAHADARRALHRADDASERSRAIASSVTAEVGAEVYHLHDVAGRVGVAADEDRGVAIVGQRNLSAFGEFDRPEPLLRIVAAEQGGEQRVAVHRRHAAPDKPGRGVDEGAHLAVADGPEIERTHRVQA
jgi:hypothetical protein